MSHEKKRLLVRSRSSLAEATAVTNLPLLSIISNLWKWNKSTDIEMCLIMDRRKTIAKDGPPQKGVTHHHKGSFHNRSESKIQYAGLLTFSGAVLSLCRSHIGVHSRDARLVELHSKIWVQHDGSRLRKSEKRLAELYRDRHSESADYQARTADVLSVTLDVLDPEVPSIAPTNSIADPGYWRGK
jgi:hypothetical protein